MRILLYLVLLFLLEGCSSVGSSSYERDSNAREASECINREATGVASTPTDLEVASATVIARCSIYTAALRRDLIARYPGYRDYIEPKVREVDEIYLAEARLAVVRARQPR
jgi:hypothetical protein